MAVVEMPRSDFELVPHRNRGPACSVGMVLVGERPSGSTGDALDDADRDRLYEWLIDPSITGTRISETLRDRRGLNVGAEAVNRHRARKCRCDR